MKVAHLEGERFHCVVVGPVIPSIAAQVDVPGRGQQRSEALYHTEGKLVAALGWWRGWRGEGEGREEEHLGGAGRTAGRAPGRMRGQQVEGGEGQPGVCGRGGRSAMIVVIMIVQHQSFACWDFPFRLHAVKASTGACHILVCPRSFTTDSPGPYGNF